ncbi:MAG: LysR family transcriptional regulator [Pseudomonadota bacterium]|nr:LysR family transcriptional regulator [Pseudomonadota bacterium]
MDRLAGLELFIRVVETGSFSKAADDLGIAQPTATKAVAAIEQRLGARLLHRSTRGITATEVGALYYDRCKRIARDVQDAENLAALLQSGVGGRLRISTSLTFGHCVLVPLALRYMAEHPDVSIDLSFDDRYVDLVEQGVDLAVRMGRLADSSLGAHYLGTNPWVMVASPSYLQAHPAPQVPSDLAAHQCVIYSSVQGDDRWSCTGSDGAERSVPVRGRLRTNNLATVLSAAHSGMGLAVLPWYVAREAVANASLTPVLTDHLLPAQDVHAVYPSPKLVSTKVTSFIAFLHQALSGDWWRQPP